MKQRASHGFNANGRLTGVFLGLLLLAAPAAAGPITQITGSTLGCFGLGCTVTADPVSDSTYGLTFTPSIFDVFTDISGAAVVPLGTFARERLNVADDIDPLPFTLQVLFTSPTGGPIPIFVGLIAGTTPGGGGPLSIDVDTAPRSLIFSDGTLDFALASDLEINKNSVETLFGTTQNADLAPVPEPASLILFGTGLVGVARRVRRRR